MESDALNAPPCGCRSTLEDATVLVRCLNCSYKVANNSTFRETMQHSGELEVSKDISVKIRKEILDWDVYEQTHPQHSWVLTNTLAQSLGRGELVFLTGLIRSHETGEIEIVAYTQDVVVHHVGEPGSKRPLFSVLPRRMLSSIEVHGAPSLVSVPTMGHHSTASYRLWYEKQMLLTLPLVWYRGIALPDLSVPRDRIDDLENFLPSLWEDLPK